MTLLEALDVLIVHLGDDTPSTPKTERARVILRAALRYHERTRQMSSDTNKTIAAGLPCEDALRAKLAEAKRLGLEAVALARDLIEVARDTLTDPATSAVVAVGCLNVADRIAAALEAL